MSTALVGRYGAVMASAFGDLLTRLLDERGLSEREFGHRVGLAGPNINYYKTSKRSPPAKHLSKMAHALGLSGTERDSFVLLGLVADLPESDRQAFESIVFRQQTIEAEFQVLKARFDNIEARAEAARDVSKDDG